MQKYIHAHKAKDNALMMMMQKRSSLLGLSRHLQSKALQQFDNDPGNQKVDFKINTGTSCHNTTNNGINVKHNANANLGIEKFKKVRARDLLFCTGLNTVIEDNGQIFS